MPDIIQIAIARKTKLMAELQELERFIKVGENLSRGVASVQSEMDRRDEPMKLGDHDDNNDDHDDHEDRGSDNVQRLGA